MPAENRADAMYRILKQRFGGSHNIADYFDMAVTAGLMNRQDIWPNISAKLNFVPLNQSSFETNVNEWLAGVGSPTKARSTAQAQHGTASMLLTATAAGPANITAYINPRRTVWPEKTYTASAHVRSGSVARNARIRIAWYDGANAWLNSAASAPVQAPTNSWVKISHTWTSPSNVATILVEVQFDSVLSGETFYVDNVSVTESF